MTKKERIAATITGIALFGVAALFSIGMILGLLDFGTETNRNFIAIVGQMLVSVYGLCSILVPAFFFVAGSFCLSARWSIQRAFVLLVSIIPFFTLVITERVCISISEQDTSPLAFVKIFTLVVIALLIVALEYLLAITLAGFIEKRISNKKNDISFKEFPAESVSKKDKAIPSETDEDEKEESSKNTFAKLKQKPAYLKNLVIKKISFAGKKQKKSRFQDFPIESLESTEDNNELPAQKLNKEINSTEKESKTPVEFSKAKKQIPLEDSENITEDENISTEEQPKKISFDWSLDDEGNLKDSPKEERNESIFDQLEDEATEKKENDAKEEIVDPDDFSIDEETSVEPVPEELITDDEPEEQFTDSEELNTDSNTENNSEEIFFEDDIIDQFEKESASLTSELESTTNDEIEYDMEFEDPSENDESEITEEEIFQFADEEPDTSNYSTDYDDYDIEESKNDDSDDLKFESTIMQDNIVESIESQEETDSISTEEVPSETADVQQDRTANFNPDNTALGDIFSQMEMDARAKVESESSGNVDPLASPVVDSNGNIIDSPKTAVTTGADGITRPIELPPKKKKKNGPYKISTDLLTAYSENEYWIIDEETKAASENLRATLKDFNIDAKVTNIIKGPVVTMFEILPAPGIKLNKIVGLADNIALALPASSVRIVAPIPGKSAVGIEVPNKKRAIVSFRECIEQTRNEWKKMTVPVVLGKDIQGETQIMDLVKTPHLLIAGSTGAGKSVCVNSMILSILYKRSPSDVKMILIDPKVVELKLYNHIPHLLTPVITESKKAMQALQYCLCEMERRYAVLDSLGCRDIANYNRKIAEQHIATEKIPYLIVIIDEFADLMATTGKQLEGVVARLCAMSRAVGIHLVLATQRPSVDVITGLIKANIPSRVAFMVAAKTDSRIIIDQVGAEKLLGKGDMLYASATDPFPVRIQGAFVSDQEVEDVVEAVKEWGEPEYIDDEIFVDDEEEEGSGQVSLFNDGADDPLYDKALDIVIQAGKASASYIQRRLSIGYNRAARLVELMEERGIVGPANGSKPREIIHMP